MKKLVFIILLSCSPGFSAAAFFDPKNYDECILENMKGVTSDVAARIVANSCQQKFDIDKNKNKNDVCQVYWDGFKFKLGNRSITQYKKYRLSVDGLEKLNIFLPKDLTTRLQFEPESDVDATKGNFGKYFKSVINDIYLICNF